MKQLLAVVVLLSCAAVTLQQIFNAHPTPIAVPVAVLVAVLVGGWLTEQSA